MQNITISGLNFDNQAEIEQIARIHQNAPVDWIPDYTVDEASVSETSRILTDSRDNPNTHVFVARDQHENLIGFHWVSLVKEEQQTSARIESLWVHETHRRRGIAKALKQYGEDWMRANGAQRVSTYVFYVNKKMIDLNIQQGFIPGQLHMSKELW
ncbi:MAG: GNAT family N-acetyltransferase [Chloroflexota bacterium]